MLSLKSCNVTIIDNIFQGYDLFVNLKFQESKNEITFMLSDRDINLKTLIYNMKNLKSLQDLSESDHLKASPDWKISYQPKLGNVTFSHIGNNLTFVCFDVSLNDSLMIFSEINKKLDQRINK